MQWPNQLPPQQGWQCPCCSRVYSPTTPMCFSCPPKVSTLPYTVPDTGAAPLIPTQPYQVTDNPPPKIT